MCGTTQLPAIASLRNSVAGVKPSGMRLSARGISRVGEDHDVRWNQRRPSPAAQCRDVPAADLPGPLARTPATLVCQHTRTRSPWWHPWTWVEDSTPKPELRAGQPREHLWTTVDEGVVLGPVATGERGPYGGLPAEQPSPSTAHQEGRALWSRAAQLRENFRLSMLLPCGLH